MQGIFDWAIRIEVIQVGTAQYRERTQADTIVNIQSWRGFPTIRNVKGVFPAMFIRLGIVDDAGTGNITRCYGMIYGTKPKAYGIIRIGK